MVTVLLVYAAAAMPPLFPPITLRGFLRVLLTTIQFHSVVILGMGSNAGVTQQMGASLQF